MNKNIVEKGLLQAIKSPRSRIEARRIEHKSTQERLNVDKSRRYGRLSEPEKSFIDYTFLSLSKGADRLINEMIRCDLVWNSLFFSQDYLADKSELERETANKHLANFEKIGLIIKTNRGFHITCSYNMSPLFYRFREYLVSIFPALKNMMAIIFSAYSTRNVTQYKYNEHGTETFWCPVINKPIRYTQQSTNFEVFHHLQITNDDYGPPKTKTFEQLTYADSVFGANKDIVNQINIATQPLPVSISHNFLQKSGKQKTQQIGCDIANQSTPPSIFVKNERSCQNKLPANPESNMVVDSAYENKSLINPAGLLRNLTAKLKFGASIRYMANSHIPIVD